MATHLLLLPAAPMLPTIGSRGPLVASEAPVGSTSRAAAPPYTAPVVWQLALATTTTAAAGWLPSTTGSHWSPWLLPVTKDAGSELDSCCLLSVCAPTGTRGGPILLLLLLPGMLPVLPSGNPPSTTVTFWSKLVLLLVGTADAVLLPGATVGDDDT
jgi:hypothetical protein